MRAQTYHQAQTIAIESAMPLHPNYPFLMSSFDSDGYESAGDNNHFEFTISRESLLDPNDIVMGDMIGQGSNSVVYTGLYQTRVPVAVKVMQPSRTAAVSIKHKENFQKEVMYLSKIKHDSIVKFVGACIEPQMMIVTELLEGGNLQKLLWESRPNTLDLRMALSYALDISRAMEFLHSKGLIHRDLKPKNVLLTSDMTHVKLADFGLVREETTSCCMTSEAGTYRWMAPEVFGRDLRIGDTLHYDHKADVYSFAIVLWELITNKLPFCGIPHTIVPYFVSQNKRPSLVDIPGELVGIIASCWAEDSNARPEFKEITITLTNLLRAVCIDESIEESDSRVNSNSNTAQTVINYPITNEEDDHHDATYEGSTTNPVQESNCQEMEPKKKKGNNNKKLRKLVSPLFKMFRACLYKP
ncbi:hypothetical protein N665_0266s0009 [Sinapis alba]|nr:hypothetical protein N665_0266s0009 [Sinapis alba]